MKSQFQLTSNEKKKSKYFAESEKMKLIGQLINYNQYRSYTSIT